MRNRVRKQTEGSGSSSWCCSRIRVFCIWGKDLQKIHEQKLLEYFSLCPTFSSPQCSFVQTKYFQVPCYFSSKAKDLIMSPSMSRGKLLIKVSGIVNKQ